MRIFKMYMKSVDRNLICLAHPSLSTVVVIRSGFTPAEVLGGGRGHRITGGGVDKWLTKCYPECHLPLTLTQMPDLLNTAQIWILLPQRGCWLLRCVFHNSLIHSPQEIPESPENSLYLSLYLFPTPIPPSLHSL